MLTSIFRSTAIGRTSIIVFVSALLSLLTACGGGSSSDNDVVPTEVPEVINNTPEGEPLQLAGTWMLNDISEESFGASSSTALQDGLKFRKTSRQLVTITQQNNTAQIQLCGEAAITANVSATGLAYDAKTYLPTISNVTDLTPIVRPLVLTRDSAGALHGTVDTGLIPVLSEPPSAYQVTRNISLVRISPDVNIDGIGALILDWSFAVTADFTTTAHRDDVVNCFVETARTRSGGGQVVLYGVNEEPTKTLTLDAETVQVTFTEGLYYQNEADENGGTVTRSPRVQRSVALKLKPAASAIGFGQSLDDLSADEEASFSSTSALLLRQQYASTPLSLTGAINIDADDQFLHAQFDLNW